MTNINTTNLADWMARHSIGLLERFENEAFRTGRSSNYPPHSILALNEDEYILTLAVAGFTKDELKVAVDDGEITVTGQKTESKMDEGARYLYQGIATRDFEKKWRLNDHMEVENVSLENGILAIRLKINKPESKKPRILDIQ